MKYIMKKFLVALAVMLCAAFPALAKVEQDIELHRVNILCLLM